MDKKTVIFPELKFRSFKCIAVAVTAAMNMSFQDSGRCILHSLLIKNGKQKPVSYTHLATEELVLKEPACASTMLYESVCGTGRAFVVEGTEEKTEALTAIMRHYDKNKKEFEFGIKAVEKTTVIRLEVEEMTGKTNRC